MSTLSPSLLHGLRLALPLAALLLLAACDEQRPSAQAAPAAPPPPEVGFVTLQPQRVPVTTELPGRTAAYRIAEVRPQIDGIVQLRLFDEGAAVEAGQPLYQIDPAVYEARLKAAEADLARAQAAQQSSGTRLTRYRQLIERSAVSRQDYDDVVAADAENRAAVAAAEAQLESARIDLDYTVVTAPIDGRIGRSDVSEGALVTANQSQALATITQLDPIYVDLTQSSGELLRTRRALAAGRLRQPNGSEARVTLQPDAEGHGYPHDGRIQFSEVLVEQSTGTVGLRAVFPNPDGELMPGLFVRARVEQGEIESAFLVPQAALVRAPDGSAFVWLIGAENRVERRSVIVNRAIGGDWLVTEGLAAGERLVVDGLQRVQPDAAVTPVAVEPAPSLAAAPAG